MFKIRHYENLHIPLWLLKDACWMFQWQSLGIFMITPTVLVAAIIAVKSWREGGDDFWINLAILFWIVGNSHWMLCEFTRHEALKSYAGWPFLLGMISVSYFYKKRFFNKNKKV